MNNATQETLATQEGFKYTFEEKGNYFTPVYERSGHIYKNTEDKPATFMASLNAGDERLYVGGGAINKAFNIAIRTDDSSNSELYELSTKMHLSCYMDCYNVEGEDLIPETYMRAKYLNIVNNEYLISKAGTLHHFDVFKKGGKFVNNPYFKDMYLYISENRLCDFLSDSLYPGDIFIDILKNNPYKNEANKAMIYCVGPKGLSTADNFKNAVYIVGKNIANAIYLYNNKKDTEDTEDIEKIDYVRICLISGGSFKHDKVSRIEVAECLIKGIHEVNVNRQVKNLVYNFAYDNDAFRQAYDKLQL
jgi:hypothetical protein